MDKIFTLIRGIEKDYKISILAKISELSNISLKKKTKIRVLVSKKTYQNINHFCKNFANMGNILNSQGLF